MCLFCVSWFSSILGGNAASASLSTVIALLPLASLVFVHSQFAVWCRQHVELRVLFCSVVTVSSAINKSEFVVDRYREVLFYGNFPRLRFIQTHTSVTLSLF